MPDLGTYSVYVLSAYGVSFVLLAGLVLRSALRARKIRQILAELETGSQKP